MQNAAVLTAPAPLRQSSLAERQKARRAAVEAYSRAYLAQPLPQRDGSVLHLCWMARLSRAYDMIAATADPAKKELYRAGVARLETQALADHAAAAAAEAAYLKLCIDAGVDATLNMEGCECDGCLETRRICEANVNGRN